MLLNPGQNAGQQNNQRRPGGEGVVLLIGRERKEEQDKARKDAQQPDRAHPELEPENVTGQILTPGIVQVKVQRLAALAAQVLHPVAAGLPGNHHESGQEQAPGKEPDQVQQPVPEHRQLVEVMREARPGKAEEVLVDEVEVPEAVHVAGGGMVADGKALIGIGQPGQNVPGRGNGQEQNQSCDRLQLPPAPPLPAQKQQRNGRGGKENGCDQTLGQHRQRQRRPHSVKAQGPGRLEAGNQTVEGQQQQKAEQRLRNGEAGK